MREMSEQERNDNAALHKVSGGSRSTAVLDLAAAWVVRALDRRDVPSVLLRGPALRVHVYRDVEREYGDIDLLVPSDAWSAAVGCVEEDLGFSRVRVNVEPLGHAVVFRNPRGIEVDLHRQVIGATVEDAVTWRVVLERSNKLSLGAIDVRIPDLPTSLVVVALHAAHHGAVKARTLKDLARAIDSADMKSWRAALEVAEQLGARDAFAAGLHLDARGRDLCASLGIDRPRSAAIRLRADSAPRSAWEFAGFLDLSPKEKLAAILKLLFPPRHVLLYRTWAGFFARRSATLALAWPIWWLRLIFQLPRAIRWYRRDRRSHEMIR